MMQTVLNDQDLVEATNLAKLVRDLNLKGHNPATSGNYSLRSTIHKDVALVSESGIDKNYFTENNFLLVDIKSEELFGDFKNSGRKMSDEGGLHLAVYQATNAGCVLHSHILESILYADLHPNKSILSFEGLELLKGFKGIKSHLEKFNFLCFENSQDIKQLSKEVVIALKEVKTFGFILRGHGIYVWGETLKDAKRHLEVFEYLFKYELALSARRSI